MKENQEHQTKNRPTREDESINTKIRESRSFEERKAEYRKTLEDGGTGRLKVRNPKPDYMYHYHPLQVRNEDIPNAEQDILDNQWEPVSPEEALEIGAQRKVGGLYLYKRHKDFVEMEREKVDRTLREQYNAIQGKIDHTFSENTTFKTTVNKTNAQFMARRMRVGEDFNQ